MQCTVYHNYRYSFISIECYYHKSFNANTPRNKNVLICSEYNTIGAYGNGFKMGSK